MGLKPEEAGGPPIEIWPDNEKTAEVFEAMSTQWRIGFAGPSGLDYNALPHVLMMSGVPRKEWPELFRGIRLMEDGALEAIRAALEAIRAENGRR